MRTESKSFRPLKSTPPDRIASPKIRHSSNATKRVKDLLLLLEISEHNCRKKYGQEAKDACLLRDNSLRELESSGYCYGKKGQTKAEMAWLPCTAVAIRSEPAKQIPDNFYPPTEAGAWFVGGFGNTGIGPACSIMTKRADGTLVEYLVDQRDDRVYLNIQTKSIKPGGPPSSFYLKVFGKTNKLIWSLPMEAVVNSDTITVSGARFDRRSLHNALFEDTATFQVSLPGMTAPEKVLISETRKINEALIACTLAFQKYR